MAICVSLINMKGGVGKTTLCAQIAHAAAEQSLRTLAVDMDPQANLSQALLTPESYAKLLREKKPTIVQLFEHYYPPSEDIASPKRIDIHEIVLKQVGQWSRAPLDLIPSRLELSHTLKNPTSKERRLAKALSTVADEYELILVDCAPTESILTEAAYHASRYVLVPVKPEYLATIGLPLLGRSIQEFKYENADRDLDICGIVFNNSSSYSTGPEGQTSVIEVEKEAKQNGWHIFSTQVRYSASYPKSAREGTSIASTSYSRWEVSSEFRKFVDEFFASIGLKRNLK